MKRFAAAVLAALMLFSLCACGSPAKMSREKLYGEIAEMVEKRKEIPEDYLLSTDGDLRQELREYNDATERLRTYYTDWGMRIASNYDLRYLLLDVEYKSERDRYLFRRVADHYETFSGRFGQACLYPDAPRRVRKDWCLSGYARFDAGSSWGLWASYMHKDFYVGDDVADQVESYFQLIDHLGFRLNT